MNSIVIIVFDLIFLLYTDFCLIVAVDLIVV